MQKASAAVPLRWYESALLALGIFEIPLQIDKYYMFRLEDADYGAVAGINVSVTTFAFALLYVFWIASVLTRTYRSTQKFVIGIPVLFYIGTIVLSIFVAADKMLTMFDILLMVQTYLVYLYIANRIRTINDLKFLLLVCFGTAVFQALLIIGLKSAGPSLYGEAIKLGPLLLTVWIDGRPAGSMHSAVLAGSFLGTIFPLALAVFITPMKGWMRWCSIATVVLTGLGILVTQTRGAILTTGISSVALSLACLGRGWLPKRLIVLGLIVAVLGVIPLMEVVTNRIQKDDNGSAEARIHLSKIAFEAIQDRPFFGYGAGNCHLAGNKYAEQAEFRSLWYYTVHNKYLVVWVETGLIGLVSFLFVMWTGALDGIRSWLNRDRFLGPVGLGFSLAILGQMLHMNVDVFNSRTQVQLLWMLLGATAAIRVLSEELKENGNSEYQDLFDDEQPMHKDHDRMIAGGINA